MGWAESDHLPFGYVLRDFDRKTAEDSRHVFTQELEQCQRAGPSTRLPPFPWALKWGPAPFHCFSQPNLPSSVLKTQQEQRCSKGLGLILLLGYRRGAGGGHRRG